VLLQLAFFVAFVLVTFDSEHIGQCVVAAIATYAVVLAMAREMR
jgi:hypothetical protein